MKSTAVSHPNIAFNKYWGNKNETLRIPYNNTISMNLSGLETKTTIEFSGGYKKDTLILNGKQIDASRTKQLLDYTRKIAGNQDYAKIVSQNNFPSGAGIASSASAYSAMALASCSALELKLDEKEISSIARLGSGSACRSIPGGFSEWIAGNSHESSYAYQIAPPEQFDIIDIVAIVSKEEKKISSTKGHNLVETSPFKNARLSATEKNLNEIRKGILNNDFELFGESLERDAVEMHCVAMTSNPKIFYWTGKSLELMKDILDLRENGLNVYFTTDAGPNIHVMALPKFKKDVLNILSEKYELEQILICKPAGKPYTTKEHLF